MWRILYLSTHLAQRWPPGKTLEKEHPEELKASYFQVKSRYKHGILCHQIVSEKKLTSTRISSLMLFGRDWRICTCCTLLLDISCAWVEPLSINNTVIHGVVSLVSQNKFASIARTYYGRDTPLGYRRISKTRKWSPGTG